MPGTIDSPPPQYNRGSSLHGGRPTVAYVDVQAVRANFAAIRTAVAPGVQVVAVVKADAYGHDAAVIAPALAAAGADGFAVATVEEAVALREANVRAPIIVLTGALPSDVAALLEYDLQVALLDVDMARAFAAVLGTRRLPVHLKIDTGMSRLGVPPAALGELLELVGAVRCFSVAGVFSHLADADDCRTAYADTQLALFREAADLVRRAGVRPRWLHLANSVATLTRSDMHFDLVRPGIALYGVAPAVAATAADWRPVMHLRTRIWQLKSVAAGRAVSYGQTFVARRPTRIAVLPIGYADGYGRALSNRGAVVIHGRRAPIIGRVCMDLTLVDVSDIGETSVGDEVLLWGRLGDTELGVSEVAGWQDTIAYELLTRLGKRVPRVVIEGDAC